MKENKPTTTLKEGISATAIVSGMILIAVGIVIPIITMSIANNTFRCMYTAGALILLVGRLMNGYKGRDIRLRRLYRIETWSAVFFCVAAFFLFYDQDSIRNALAFTLAGGIIQVYTSIMIPRAAKK